MSRPKIYQRRFLKKLEEKVEKAKRYIIKIKKAEQYIYPQDLLHFNRKKIVLKINTNYQGKTGIYQVETNSKKQYELLREYLDKERIRYTTNLTSHSS